MHGLTEVFRITADHLRSVLQSYGADLVEGEIVEANDVARINEGRMRPTAFITIGAPRAYRGGRGIIGVKHDLGTVDGVVLCTAEAYGDCLALVSLVTNTLHGFRPANTTGEVECIGSAQRSPVPGLSRPIRYGQTVGFRVLIGADSVVT